MPGSVPGYEHRAAVRGGSVTGYAEVEWSTARVETAQLLLRPLRPRDLDELRRVDEDGRLWQWAAADDRGTSWMRTAVTERSTGRLLGVADLSVDPWRCAATARLEVWIAGWARRRGYGGEVARSLSAWAFRHGMARVELLADPVNEPAQRLALAAGFRREGQLRAALPTGRSRTDAIVYARLATDSALPLRRGLPDVRELSDGVVTVRRVRPGDEDALLEERLDPESRRWATSTRLWTASDVKVFVAGAASAWLAGTEARFAIVETGTGDCAGSLGLRMTVPAFRIAEIGYGLRAGWRGRGLATRAVRLVADWAFIQVGIARLELGAAAANTASRRVAVRAGFQLEGVARLRLPTSDGGRTDEARFGLMPPS
jgi:RimJ/RimL family protein N-acetyltransferase